MQAEQSPYPHRSIRLRPVYDDAMSVKKTTSALPPSGFPRLRLSAHAKIVLRGRYLAKNCAGTIDETPAQLFWRVARDIAQAERLYPLAGRLPHAAQRWYNCMTRLDFLPNSPTLMNAGRRLLQLSACFVLPVEDSLASIYDSLKHQALTNQSGGGTGFSFGHVALTTTESRRRAAWPPGRFPSCPCSISLRTSSRKAGPGGARIWASSVSTTPTFSTSSH